MMIQSEAVKSAFDWGVIGIVLALLLAAARRCLAAAPTDEGQSHRTAAPVRDPKTIAAVLALVGLAALWLPNAPGKINDYHPDEGVWTVAGRDAFASMFIEGDFSAAAWEDKPLGHFGDMNPAVGKLFIGAALFGTGAVDERTHIVEIGEEFEWSMFEDFRPEPRVLRAARLPSLVFGCLAAGFMFLLASELARSRVVGVFAALLLLLSPIAIQCSQRAIMDSPAMSLSLASMWLAARLFLRLGSIRLPHAVALSAGLGVALALAAGHKMSAGIVALAICAWVFIPLRDAKRRLGPLAVVVATAIVIFVGSNPALYRRPLKQIERILRLPAAIAKYEGVDEARRINSWGEGWSATWRMGLEYSGPINSWVGVPWVDPGLAILGLLMVTVVAVRRPKSGPPHAETGRMTRRWALVWVGASIFSTVALLPFIWSRWYLPVEAVWSFLEAIPLAGAVSLLSRSRSAGGSRPAPALSP